MRGFRIRIFFLFSVMLIGCTGNAIQTKDIELSQSKVYSADEDRENSADKSDADDTTEESVEAEQTDKTAEEAVETEQADKIAEDKADQTDGAETDNSTEDSVETAETGESDDVDTVYLKPCNTYQDILDNAYEVIVADYTTHVIESDDAFTYVGVAETRIGRDIDETLACIGYTLFDVDGNGVEELIIVDTSEDDRILIMASLLDDKPVEVAGGWARSRFYLLNDNTVYYEGSGGAAYTTFATYRMAKDGVSLEVIDYYFSDYRDDSFEEYWLVEGNWGWFHNITGEQKKEESEWVEFENEDEPWEMQEAYIAQVKDLDLTFFTDLRKSN